MGNVNVALFSGNLTRDPETAWKSEDGETAIVKFGVAVNRQRKGEDGSYIEEVSFIDVETFGRFAVLVAKKLRKGDSATVSGRLQQNTWEQDGQNRSKLVVVADQIDSDGFFRAKEENAAVVVGSNPDGPPPEAAAPAAAPAEAPATPAVAPDDDIPF